MLCVVHVALDTSRITHQAAVEKPCLSGLLLVCAKAFSSTVVLMIANAELLTPAELAKRLKVTRATVYNHLGHWGPSEGVVRLGSRCTRIDWPTFWQRLMAGKISLKGGRDENE